MHVGIIPDGQRRWARARGITLQQAYAIGFSNGIDIAAHLCNLGVRYISVFALSNDNYMKRSADELEALISQLVDGMGLAAPRLRVEGIGVHIVGNVNQLSCGHRRMLHGAVSAISEIEKPRAEMNVLVNYDIVWDFNRPFENHETRNICDCDLIFRSGGVKRLSGFLPKQSAYSELFFSTKLWPEVTKSDFEEVISEFKATSRNFGA